MDKGDLVELTITDMTEDGQGIGRAAVGGSDSPGEGIAIFVDGAVIGDEVIAEIVKTKKRYAFAKLRELKKASKLRVSETCPYIEECGGCAYGRLSYDAQLQLKEKHVRDKIERVAGIKNPIINPIIPMNDRGPHSQGYRNKAVMAVYVDKTGKPLIGFRGRKSHKVIDCKTCRIQAEPAMIVAEVIREYGAQDGASVKWLKEITVKTAFATGEVMVIFGVENLKHLPDLDDLIIALNEAIEEPYSLESISAFDGKKTVFLAGRGTIEDEICGLKFEISPQSFYQVNPVQAEKLYEKALSYIDAASEYEVLDIYCGVGTIGLIAAGRIGDRGKVIGVESVKSAVLDANRNAVINGIVNAVFIKGEAETVIPERVESGEIQSADLVILDPPRRGCAPELLESIMTIKPKKIVYVSCDPATLARDIKALEPVYELRECTPVDMFCDTGHIETVALMIKTENAE